MFNRLIIYTKKPPEMAEFYCTNFGYTQRPADPDDRLIELVHPANALTLLLHPAARTQKQGQNIMKLVFDTDDVPKLRDQLIRNGIEVGPIHSAPGYEFANLKDPSGNPVSISSRAFSER